MKIRQTDRVLNYIKEFGFITRKEAFLDLGIANLTAVISDLRKFGNKIITEDVKSKNRYGDNITYALYKLEEE